MSNTSNNLFRIRFYHEDKVCVIYARFLATEAVFGFLEVEDIVFQKRESDIVDPTEEKLRAMFEDVVCTYIPLQAVIRIDEVKNLGAGKVIDLPEGASTKNMRPFPGHSFGKSKKSTPDSE
jgi:hypothetical protein